MAIMIDVGASNGIYSKNFNGTVHAFEPNKTNVTQLRHNCGLRENYHIYELAVSNVEGPQPFYEANYTNSSSLLPFTKKGLDNWKNPVNVPTKLKTIREYQVDCIRLDNFLENQGINNQIINLVKVDTQGNDLNVIKSLGIYLENVKELVAEVQITENELYSNSSSRKNMVEYMNKHNFCIKNVEKWSKGQEENLTFANNRFN